MCIKVLRNIAFYLVNSTLGVEVLGVVGVVSIHFYSGLRGSAVKH